MTEFLSKSCTAFAGSRLLASGPLVEVALAVKAAVEGSAATSILVFDDATGRVIDIDVRGTKADMIAGLARGRSEHAGKPEVRSAALSQSPEGVTAQPRGPGRPKLGVVAREVTLLPRHWEWLATQPGGASVALRRLVEEARRAGGTKQQIRAAQEAAYHFMVAMAGDLPGFEEATRALFADDRARFERHIASWPDDVRGHAIKLAFAARQVDSSPTDSREREGKS
jgi:hypothetical protein